MQSWLHADTGQPLLVSGEEGVGKRFALRVLMEDSQKNDLLDAPLRMGETGDSQYGWNAVRIDLGRTHPEMVTMIFLDGASWVAVQALLKWSEETPGGQRLAFAVQSHQPHIPQTLLSRCCHVEINTMSSQELLQIVPDANHDLLLVSEGQPGRLLWWHEHIDHLDELIKNPIAALGRVQAQKPDRLLASKYIRALSLFHSGVAPLCSHMLHQQRFSLALLKSHLLDGDLQLP